jgi:hypothetical protein
VIMDRAATKAVVAATVAGTGLAGLAGLLGCSGGSGVDGHVSQRQDEVAERGAEVMPFDLDATTHRFDPTAEGLVQTVTADDPDDTEQVALVREHLAAEAERFRRGDFADPAAIHGDAMPGLAELEAGAAAVTIDLAEIGAGAQLTFSTDDAALVDALHRWGEAQTMDHGAHADG